jgi:hypothetical protein
MAGRRSYDVDSWQRTDELIAMVEEQHEFLVRTAPPARFALDAN